VVTNATTTAAERDDDKLPLPLGQEFPGDRELLRAHAAQPGGGPAKPERRVPQQPMREPEQGEDKHQVEEQFQERRPLRLLRSSPQRGCPARHG
jgi:hypothetical protein